MTVEVICATKPDPGYDKYKEPNGKQVCDGVDAKKVLPTNITTGKVHRLAHGDHVKITGKWVQDSGYPSSTHPKWNEIHPVEKIELLK